MNKAEMLRLIRLADKALGGTSNDAEHDALYEIRGALAEAIGYAGPVGNGKGDYAP